MFGFDKEVPEGKGGLNLLSLGYDSRVSDSDNVAVLIGDKLLPSIFRSLKRLE